MIIRLRTKWYISKTPASYKETNIYIVMRFLLNWLERVTRVIDKNFKSPQKMTLFNVF